MDISLRGMVFLFASFFLSFSLIYQGAAQQSETEGIPLAITTGPVQEVWHTQAGHELKRRSLTLNESILQYGTVSSGEKIQLSLFENEEYTATISRSVLDVNNVHTMTARIDGTKFGYISISHNNGQSLGTIKIIESNIIYRIVTDSYTGIDYVYKVDPAQVDEIEGAEPLIPEIGGIDEMIQKETNEVRDDDDPVVIDVMVVYTQAAQNWAGGHPAILNVVAQAMANGQLAIDNSEINLEIRLVHSGLVDYSSAGTNCGTDLRRLTASPNFNPWGPDFSGYMEEVHEWRDAWGADLVALFTVTQSCGGIAWLLNSTDGRPLYGFSLTRVQQAATGFTHVHELGHNMGNHHSRNQSSNPAPPSGGLFTYSTGWRWWDTDNSHYVSVMTYAEGGTRVPVFSNPDIDWHNVPSGSYQGTHAPADNARSMREIKEVISNYRTTMAVPALAYPEDGEEDLYVELFLGWNEFPGAASYQIQVADNDDFTTPLVDTETADTSLFVDSLDPDSEYYWRVKALNPALGTDWSEVRSFTTAEGLPIPDQITLAFPADGDPVVVDESEPQVLLGWYHGWPQVDNYGLEIATDADFTDIIYTNDNISDTNYTFLNPDEAVTYWWRVHAENETGWGPFSDTWSFSITLTGTGDGIEMPVAYKLLQNYPNPFNPSTTIRYAIPERSIVTIEIFNVLGQRISTLVNAEMEAGYHETAWHSGGAASGVYFYRIEAVSTDDVTNRFIDIKRMFLLK